MNYWLAENTNLSECHQPLFDFMEELAVNGAQTAAVNYNIKEGWVVHHNSTCGPRPLLREAMTGILKVCHDGLHGQWPQLVQHTSVGALSLYRR
ncbi:hypothetical protein KUH03_04480 [Sphingobacterium sp. E70]|nr:hypothetical protein [Sphingobacterium sp. E70]ULT26195.1 hypothetical protein KUH03_04480 [Sphingobacterium sp. E70]